MVVEQRLRHVQQFAALDPKGREPFEQRVKVPERRLVRTDVFGGDDKVKLDAESAVAAAKDARSTFDTMISR